MKIKPRYELTFVMDSGAAEALSRSAATRFMADGQTEILTDRYFDFVASPRDVVSKKGAGKKKHTKASKIGKLPSGHQYRVRQTDGAWEAKLQTRKWAESNSSDPSACIDSSSLRETRIPSQQLVCLDLPTVDQAWSGKWFHKKIIKHKLAPAMDIQLDRHAMQMKTLDGDIRLTIDQNIRFQQLNSGLKLRTTESLATQTPATEFDSIPDKVLVRMKYCVSLPALFKALIYEFALLPLRTTVYQMCSENALNSSATSSLPESNRRTRPINRLHLPHRQIARFEVPTCLYG